MYTIYKQLLTDVDFYDTLLDLPHLKASFPGYKARPFFFSFGLLGGGGLSRLND